MTSEDRRRYPTGDGSAVSVTQPISPEALELIKTAANERLTELCNDPLEILEERALRGRLPINMSLATNIIYLTEKINPAIRAVLEVQGGELVWLDRDPKYKSGVIRYSSEGLAYVDPDTHERELLDEEPRRAPGVFFWTPQAGLNMQAVEDALKVEDPSLVGFAQESLSNLIGRATLLVFHGGHSASFTNSRYLLKNPQPSRVPPISI